MVEYVPPKPVAQVNPVPTGDDGKPRLGRFGELLDADRNQILGTCLFKEAHVRIKLQIKAFAVVLLGPMRCHFCISGMNSGGPMASHYWVNLRRSWVLVSNWVKVNGPY